MIAVMTHLISLDVVGTDVMLHSIMRSSIQFAHSLDTGWTCVED